MNPSTDTRAPGGGKLVVPLAAALFLALVAVVGVALFFLPSPDDGGAETVTPEAAVEVEGPPSAGAENLEPDRVTPHAPQRDSSLSVCGLAVADTPADAVLGAKTVVVSGIRVPSLAGVGPGTTEGGIPACYQHSPAGAVLAAASYLQFFSESSDLELVIRTRVADDEVRQVMLDALERSGVPERARVQLHGYSIASWDDSLVSVQLAVSMPDVIEGVVAWPLNLVWRDGDWKVAASGEPGVRFIGSPANAGMVDWTVP